MSQDLVIFDVDGTLVDSTYLHAYAWARAFDEHGHRIPDWLIHRSIGMGGDKLVAALLGDDVEKKQGDALREAWKKQYEPLADQAHPLPGAADAVRAVHEKGFGVALASSGEKEFVDEAMKSLELGGIVDVVVSATDVSASKPDPDLLQVTLEKAGAARAVMVGDSIYDIEAAARIGLRCVTVRTGGFGVDELERTGAAVVLEDLTEVDQVDWADLMRAATQ